RLGARIMPGLAGQNPDYRGVKIVTGQSGVAAATELGFICAASLLLQRRAECLRATPSSSNFFTRLICIPKKFC
ncbi:hypothetical protein, partial [Burkholderia vietnamiensis]|uniref:hypothetical protein n=1 Tax=Burkholderia vietnamiensis TaxID=60552 RepID=UPI001E50E47A